MIESQREDDETIRDLNEKLGVREAEISRLQNLYIGGENIG